MNLEWISVNDHLPGLAPKECQGTIVRVFAKGSGWKLNLDAVYSYYGRFLLGNDDITDYVTHWMPIPPNPESA